MSSLHIRPSPRWSLWGTVRIMSNLYDAALTVVTTTNFISIIVVSLLFSYVVYRNHIASSRKLSLPPGPKPWPLIGNTFDVPRSFQWSTFTKWAEEYGPVYSLILGSSVMIVLSSDQAIKDLLDKRSNIYSSRPPVYIGQILSGATETTNGLRMLFMVCAAMSSVQVRR